jgi:hypothetical protein
LAENGPEALLTEDQPYTRTVHQVVSQFGLGAISVA